MATFKQEGPPSITGNTQKDIENLFSYVESMNTNISYVLSAIDEDNLTESIINKLGISKEE